MLNHELSNDIIESYKKAFDITVNSIELPSEAGKPNTTQLKLHQMFMQINPYALMTPTSIDKVMDIVKSNHLRDFFIRLTSRFNFLYNPTEHDTLKLYTLLWKSCNVHDPLISINSKVGIAVNKLGEENSEQQLTCNEAISLLAYNRWYAMVCLFTLIYNGDLS